MSACAQQVLRIFCQMKTIGYAVSHVIIYLCVHLKRAGSRLQCSVRHCFSMFVLVRERRQQEIGERKLGCHSICCLNAEWRRKTSCVKMSDGPQVGRLIS